MSSSEKSRRPEKPGNLEPTVQGTFIDISLGDDHELESRLANRKGIQHYLSPRNQVIIPPPLDSFDLSSYWDDFEDQPLPHIYGNLTFSPSSLESAPGSWPYGLLKALETEIEERMSADGIVRLPHDTQALYVILDNEYALRVSLNSTHEDVGIDFDLVLTNEMQLAVDSSLPRGVHTDVNPLGALHYTAIVMSAAMETLYEVYSQKPGDRNRFNLTGLPLELGFEGDDDTDESTEPVEGGAASSVGSTALVLAGFNPEAESQPHLSEFLTEHTQTFSDLGGLESVKRSLMDIGDIFQGSVLALRYGLAPQHFILHGPAGTGKTKLVEALGQYCNTPIRMVRSSDFSGIHVSESANGLNQIFEEAYAGARIILFFDEIDSIAAKSRADDKTYGEILRILQVHLSQESPKYPHVLIAAATNRDIDDLDPAVTRSGRLEKIHVPLPDEADRRDIWASTLGLRRQALSLPWGDEGYDDGRGKKTDENPVPGLGTFDIVTLATLTDGWSGADIQTAITNALKSCYRAHITTGMPQTLTQDILVSTVQGFARG